MNRGLSPVTIKVKANIDRRVPFFSWFVPCTDDCKPTQYYISSQIALIHTQCAHAMECTVGLNTSSNVSTSKLCRTELVFVWILLLK